MIAKMEPEKVGVSILESPAFRSLMLPNRALPTGSVDNSKLSVKATRKLISNIVLYRHVKNRAFWKTA